MSEGPIKQERAARKTIPASTAATTSVHASGRDRGRGYCGTKQGERSRKALAVTCANCVAAMRADGIDTKPAGRA